jgi:SAM-dependent methyltransferase
MLRTILRPASHAARSFLGINGLSSRVAAMQASIRQLSREPVSSEIPASVAMSAPSLDINHLLHHSRGALLRTMPAGAQRLLSAGCAGSWYFDWIEETYGHVAEHLGIEYYAPEPHALPNNVTWICNTASNMSAVESASCDLVFSGQNVEHLWPDEVSGFLLEAARVLKPGGYLVVDSPNRLMTAPLNWSHPEHTIELTIAEITALMQMAGFDVTATYGIWLCRDARDGRLLAFDPKVPEKGWSITERLIVARDRPADSFVWWVEGVRNDRTPDAEGVRATMDGLFRQHWPERVQRLVVPAGHQSRRTEEGDWIISTPSQGGVVFYGPYMPLRAGRYRVTWRIEPAADASSPVAICDVVAGGDAKPITCHEVAASDRRVSLEFTLRATTFGLQFRCLSTGGAGFSVLRKIDLEEHPDN